MIIIVEIPVIEYEPRPFVTRRCSQRRFVDPNPVRPARQPRRHGGRRALKIPERPPHARAVEHGAFGESRRRDELVATSDQADAILDAAYPRSVSAASAIRVEC